ncbi:MAG: adenylate/guanylate cyclase domain-containing protein, partial [Bacteroidetes bacterium]|nr:adenylate/guanylate cyclase domain-containing protein [Bacteroidota bacterium]
RRKKLTIFFSDIKGFTEITDTLESEVLSNLLNNYLDEMAQIALRYGGTIDKFIGDAVMVFFGDPQTNGEKADAIACVRMAIEMREKMIDLRMKWRNEGIASPLHIRCGVNTGFCTVGNFGCENRMDYTIVGGQVNLASRLESRALMDQILISHETYALIKDEIYCEPQDDIFVKGIHYAIRAYQVVDTYEALQSASMEFVREMKGFNLAINFKEVERETALLQLREAINHLSNKGDVEKSMPGLFKTLITPEASKKTIN